MRGKILSGAAPAALGLGLLAAAGACSGAAPTAKPAKAEACDPGNGGIVLPPGFCATIFADHLGAVRQLAVSASGVVYANRWSGAYYPNGKAPEGGFLLALQDTDGDGHADKVTPFGVTAADGSKGGVGIGLHQGFVYAEMNDKIVRYALPTGGAVPTGKPQVVLSGMPLGGDHPMHPFVIDGRGQMFVDMATATNACQPKNRVPGVPGSKPCAELQTRGGIWRYDANRLGQVFSPAGRYATGIRNAEGLAFDAAGRLFATQHGRDQLIQDWPKLYPDTKQATDLPSEELLSVRPGGDYGWPECYYDPFQKKLVLAPEYGGDGGRTVGVCAQKIGPVAAYPAHWAPNALAIYQGAAFPAAYRGGAFIAFHGSWNRAPEPQGGYNVVFQPLKDGRASGRYIVFADGFAGADKTPSKASHRPTGLAVGPDGALYVSDDVGGRIWKVTYRGPANARVAGAAEAPTRRPPAQAEAPTAGGLPLPTGVSPEQVANGRKLFASSGCSGCHGADAAGSPIAPDLTAGTWRWSDGSVRGIAQTITKGVPEPKQYRSPMPPMGGAKLTPAEIQDVAAFVWSVGHKGR